MKTKFIDGWIVILLAAIVLLLCLPSCSISRKVNKQEISTVDNQKGLSDTKSTVTDKSVIVTTETTKGETVVPGVKVQSESTGMTTESVVDGNVITATYDKVTNTIKTAFTGKPVKVPVVTVKKTETQADVQKVETAKVDTSKVSKSDIVVKDKDSKTSYIVFGIVGLVLLVGIGFVIYKYVKTRVG
jgi:hypothetical protein